MPVYVDTARHPFRGYIMCHMVADTLAELHAMADAIGMRREWMQVPPKASFPHYDVPEARRELALSLGAFEVSPREGLHYAAKLGLEWAELNDDPARARRYARTLKLSRKYLETM